VGITSRRYPDLPDQIEAAIDLSRRIHFKLDGVGDIAQALKLGSEGWRNAPYTFVELYYIKVNGLVGKTDFYLDGGKIPTPREML
jgi:hypothetical protein